MHNGKMVQQASRQGSHLPVDVLAHRLYCDAICLGACEVNPAQALDLLHFQCSQDSGILNNDFGTGSSCPHNAV